jgi:beta-mannosidase
VGSRGLELEAVAERPLWGATYYYQLLPRIVAELDPARPYWPGSPYSGTPDRHPNDPAYGTTHVWDVWNTDDYTKYAAYRPRFVSEFGFQGPAHVLDAEAGPLGQPARPRLARHGPPPEGRRAATGNSNGAWPTTCPPRATSTTGTTSRS